MRYLNKNIFKYFAFIYFLNLQDFCYAASNLLPINEVALTTSKPSVCTPLQIESETHPLILSRPISTSRESILFLIITDANFKKFIAEQKTRLLEFLALGITAVANSDNYPLSGKFGLTFCNVVGIENVYIQNFLFHFMGISTIFAKYSLGAVTLMDILKPQFKSPLLKEFSLKEPKAKKAFKFIARGLSIVGATAAFYYVDKAFALPLGGTIALGIFTFIPPSFYLLRAQHKLLNQFETTSIGARLFGHYHGTADQIQKRKFLLKRIEIQKNSLSLLREDQINDLYNFYTNLTIDHVDRDNELNIKLFGIQIPSSATSSTLNSLKYQNYLGKTLGFLMGVGTAYTYTYIMKGAAQYVASWFGVSQNDKIEAFFNTYTALGTIPWALLSSEASISTFSSLFPIKCNDIKVKIFSIIGSIFSALPVTYLSIQLTQELSPPLRTLIVSSTFMGLTCIRINPLQQIIYYIKDLILEWKGDTFSHKKLKLIKLYNTVSSIIANMKGEEVETLYDNIISSNHS